MENLTSQELAQALPEVRKAYRLLYVYQTRILQLMQHVVQSSDWQFEGGYQRFSRKLGHDKNISLNRWAWDWLPMNLYAFHFHMNSEVPNHPYKMDIYHQADTGWDDREDEKTRNKNDLRTFASVEGSSTRLIFTFRHIELEGLYEQVKGRFPSTSTNWLVPDDAEKGKYRIIGQAFPLADITSLHEVEEKLKEFQNFCSDHWDSKINFFKIKNDATLGPTPPDTPDVFVQ